PDPLVVPGGESLSDVFRRSVGVIEEIIENNGGETIQICSHDAVNKVLLCHFLGLELSSFWKFKQGNGCINIIDVLDRNNFMIMLVNDTCHLGGIVDSTAEGAL
ncbi:phosphoserine phosphatase, partial [Candidatus Hakubella thermalkaliphila]